MLFLEQYLYVSTSFSNSISRMSINGNVMKIKVAIKRTLEIQFDPFEYFLNTIIDCLMDLSEVTDFGDR